MSSRIVLRFSTVAGLACCLALLPTLAACAFTSSVDLPKADAVERGRYLVNALACNDCHTPFIAGPDGPEPDMTRQLSGHPSDFTVSYPQLQEPWIWAGTGTNTAFAGPWGISFASNLTPDENTGIGVWTQEIFINTLRTGKHWGQSRPILPPMPWPAYASMTDEDLKAIWAYLRSIPAIRNQAPEALPPVMQAAQGE